MRKRCVMGGLLFSAVLVLIGPAVDVHADDIIMKILVVNPSDTETKNVDIRSPLPPEVKPEHVVDADGLEVDYDPQAGACYIRGTVSLKPKESLTKVIRIQDVWVIPSERFTSLRQETTELMEKLRGSEFEERGKLLEEAIRRRLADVEASQAEGVTTNPQLHISRYRENKQILQLVETDLVSLRQLVVMAAIGPKVEQILSGSQPGSETSGGTGPGRLSILATWWIIFIVLILLGVVSVSFFVVWQRQLKAQLARQASMSDSAESAASQTPQPDQGASSSLPPPS